MLKVWGVEFISSPNGGVGGCLVNKLNPKWRNNCQSYKKGCNNKHLEKNAFVFVVMFGIDFFKCVFVVQVEAL